MCTKKLRNTVLPEQEKLCSQHGSACRYIEVKTGWSKWEKRLAVFIQDDPISARLFIYKQPLLGTIYSLNSLSKVNIHKEDDKYVVQMVANKNQKIEFRLDGKDSTIWLGAILSSSYKQLKHTTHEANNTLSTTQQSGKDLKNQLLDKPEENYTGTRPGYKPPKSKEDHHDPLNKTQSIKTKGDTKKSDSTTQGTKKTQSTKAGQDGTKDNPEDPQDPKLNTQNDSDDTAAASNKGKNNNDVAAANTKNNQLEDGKQPTSKNNSK